MSMLSPVEFIPKAFRRRILVVRKYLSRPTKHDTETALRLRSSVDLTTVKAGEEAIILDKRSGEYFGLNPTARFLWEGIVSGTDRDELLQGYMSYFGVSQDHAIRDYSALLSAMQSNGIVN